MSLQIGKLSETMNRQASVYKEIASLYKIVKLPKMGAEFDTISAIYTRIDASYLQIQRMISEVFKPLNRQLYYELSVVESRLQEIKSASQQLAAAEKKLTDKKTLFFEQQMFGRWEIPTDCTIPMDTLYTNRVIAIR